MIGKIKDFIYNFNDIFVALVILLLAGGIIVWKLADIMEYPVQQAEHKPETNSSIDFSDIDLTPEEVSDINTDPENVTANGSEENITSNTTEENTTAENQTETNTSDENATAEDPAGNGTQGQTTGDVKEYTININAANKNTNWSAVGNELLEKGIITNKEEFIKTVNKLKLSGNLQASKFTVNSGMSYEEIIKKLCNKK